MLCHLSYGGEKSCGTSVAQMTEHSVGLLRALSRVSWSVNPSLMLLVYRGLIGAYLECGAPLFMAASRSTLGILDRVQNKAYARRLGLYAFDTGCKSTNLSE